MSQKFTQDQELEAIMEALKAFPHGALLTDIRQKTGMQLIKRTWQRRMERLVEEGKVIAEGPTKTRLYRLTETGLDNRVATTTESTKEITLSEKAKAILKAIAIPAKQRKSVGYQFAFLDNYQPNKTFYLSSEERKMLRQTGITSPDPQPAGTYARKILERLLVDLSWNSSRLEGNTYSLLETSNLIRQGIASAEKSVTDTEMILNHKEAIEFLIASGEDEIGFNRYTIQGLHALLSNNLLPEPAASGRLRTFAVGIGGSVYQPLDNGAQIEEAFDRILEKAAAIENPFEQAFFAMVQLPYLQPFDDVNKRVSRLAVNIPLTKHNLAPLSFTGVPQDLYISGLLGVYELNRVELLKDVFLWAYRKSAENYAAIRQTIGEPDPFRLAYRDQLRLCISGIINDALSVQAASERIKEEAANIPAEDRAKFIETADRELLSLHEGNFSRYKVTMSAFRKWKSGWDV